MDKVTALVLFCCTPNLIEVSIGSFRKFYPEMKLIVIDNSGKKRKEGPPCTQLLQDYCSKDKNIELHVMSNNLGHGLGMHIGIQKVKTTYTYVFESDTRMDNGGLIEAMLKLASPEVYSVGPTVKVDYKTCSASDAKTSKRRIVRRLWPYASLLSTETYFKFPPWDSDNGINAAPLLKVTQSIADTGRDEELMIEFDVDKYVKHLYGGTRAVIGIPRLENHEQWTSRYLKST
jgi:hypothetical protein